MPTTTRYALAALLGLGLAACGGGTGGTSSPAPARAVVRGGTLNVLGEQDISNLDPAPAYDTNSAHLLRLLERQLYSNPASDDTATRAKTVPDLADGPPVLGNGDTTYTIRIKKGVRWNTAPARQITARDAVRGLKMVCNPVLPFGAINYFTDTVLGMKAFCDGFAGVSQTSAPAVQAYVEGTPVPGLVAVDDSTLRVTLKAPAADFLHLLTLTTSSPRPVEAMAYVVDSPQFRQDLVESGPYQIQSYVPDKSYLLVRNPAWDPATDTLRQANVDKVSVTLGLDQASIQQQIQAGTADLALGNEPVPAAALATLSRQDDPGLHVNPTGGQNPYLAINLVGPNPALHKLEVRQALNYAVNKRNIVQVVGGSKVARATGQIFNESVVGPGFTVQDTYRTADFAGDPTRAKQLLAQAGYPNGLTLVLAYRSSGNGPKIAETLVADLKASGITVTPKEIPSRDYYPRFMQKSSIAKQGQWDIALPGWSPDWEGASERSFFTPILDGRGYGDGSTNFGGYNDDAVNAAADEALATTDLLASAKQWDAIDGRIMDDAPWVPIYEQIQANFVSRRVKNFQYYFTGSQADMSLVSVG